MTEEFRRTGRDQVSIRDIDGTGNLKVFVTTPGEVTSEHTGEPQGAKKIVIPGAICPKGAGNRRWQPDQKLAGWLAKIVRQTDGRDTDGHRRTGHRRTGHRRMGQPGTGSPTHRGAARIPLQPEAPTLRKKRQDG